MNQFCIKDCYGMRLVESEVDATECRNINKVSDEYAQVEYPHDVIVTGVWFLIQQLETLSQDVFDIPDKDHYAIVGERGETNMLLWGAKVHLIDNKCCVIWDEGEL